jgi:hypothetical protein
MSGNAPIFQPSLFWMDLGGFSHYMAFDNVTKEEWDEGATVTEHPVEQGPDIADHIRVKLSKCTLTIRSTNEPMNVSSNAGSTPGKPTGDAAALLPLPISIPSTLFPSSPASVIVYEEWVNPITLRALAQAAAGGIGGAAGGSTGNQIGAVAGSLLAALLLQAQAQTDIQQNTLGLPNVLYPPLTFQTQQWPLGTDYVAALHAQLLVLKNAAQLFTVFGSFQTENNMAIESLTFTRSGDTGTGEDITIGFKQITVVSTQTVAVPIASLPAGGGVPTVATGQQVPTPAPTSVAVPVVMAAQSVIHTVGSVLGGP